MFNMLKGLKKPVRIDAKAYQAKMEARNIDPETGHPVPDPTPIAPPIGYKKQPSMVELVREMVRSERMRQEAEAAGYESFEDADDFEVGDDPAELRSGWENDYEPPIVELIKAGKQSLQEKKAKADAEAAQQAPPGQPKREPKAPPAGSAEADPEAR